MDRVGSQRSSYDELLALVKGLSARVEALTARISLLETENAELYEGSIVSDVWLYNRVPAPEIAPWKGSGNAMPFLNSAEYVTGEALQEPSPDRFSVSWSDSGGPDLEVAVCIDDRPVVGARVYL
jgi:hypothetical protein